MKRSISTLVAGTAVAALATSVLGAPASAAPAAKEKAPKAMGLTADGKLVSFRTDAPRKAKTVGAISGLAGDTKVIGIDYRPANRTLYAVGDQGGVYTVKGLTGAATKVSQLTVALDGTQFGVDFNPAADRLRVVSNTGQNLRHDVATGGQTITDTALNTPPAAGSTAGITAAAYTNDDVSADTGTVLYDIDTTLDQVVAQVPANAGTLSLVGKLGVDAGTSAGFDIHSTLDGDRAVTNTGYGILKVPGGSKLFTIDLGSGKATLVKGFPGGLMMTDLAVKLDK